MATKLTPGHAGDWIEVHQPGGGPPRKGKILEVIGREHHQRYRVHWIDEHESIFFPADGAHIVPGTGTALTTAGAASVIAHLEALDASFRVIEHPPTERALDEADAAGWPREGTAKTVVLQDGPGYLLAVIPATRQLDLAKVRAKLGDRREVRLATESEIARDLPSLEVGATPPVGPVLPRVEIVDQRLLDEGRVLCAGGDHTHSILIDPGELAYLADAEVADICVDD